MERLRRMAGLRIRKKEIKKFRKITDVTLDDLWRRKKEKELEERYELAKKKHEPLKLVDNFHWQVYMARQKKKLTRKQVARELGESETAIKMIENKELPGEAFKLISKLEQYFGIKLKEKEPKIEKVVKKTEEKKEEVKVPEKIEVEVEEPEKETKLPEKEKEIEPEIEVRGKLKKPARILKFDKKTIEGITIGDLQTMKERKEEKEKLREQEKLQADELMEEIDKEESEKEKKRWKHESETSLIGDEIELN